MKLKDFEILFAALNKFRDNRLNFNFEYFHIRIIIHEDRSYYIEFEFDISGKTRFFLYPEENLEPENWIACNWLTKEQRQEIVNWLTDNKGIF